MQKCVRTVLILLACSALGSQASLALPAAEPRGSLSLKQEAVPAAFASLFRRECCVEIGRDQPYGMLGPGGGLRGRRGTRKALLA